MIPMSAPRRLMLLVILAAALSGCYMPADFQSDLRIKPDGNYNFRYQGRLIHVPLLEKLQSGPLSREELTERVAAIERDLARDAGFKEIAYIDDGAFRVRYERVGNIRRQKSYNFVRQNARILSIEMLRDGTIRIFGDKPNTQIGKRLEDRGVVMRGRFRVQTEGQVTRHNADSVRGGPAAIYVWQVDGFAKSSPSMIIGRPGG